MSANPNVAGQSVQEQSVQEQSVQEQSVQEMARDLALSMALLHGGHGFYREVLAAFQKHGGNAPDVASLVEALDKAVRGHAHHDLQAQRLLEKYQRHG